MKSTECRTLVSGGRVSNAWITYLYVGNNSWKRLLIPHVITGIKSVKKDGLFMKAIAYRWVRV
jgi:hypothetical protein